MRTRLNVSRSRTGSGTGRGLAMAVGFEEVIMVGSFRLAAAW